MRTRSFIVSLITDAHPLGSPRRLWSRLHRTDVARRIGAVSQGLRGNLQARAEGAFSDLR